MALSFLVLRKPFCFFFFLKTQIFCVHVREFFHIVNVINIFLSLALLLPSGIPIVLIVDQSSILLILSS